MFLVLQFLHCKFMESIEDVSILQFFYTLNVPDWQLCFGHVSIQWFWWPYNVSGNCILVVYNVVITRLSYALLWVLIVLLLSYILLLLVSWCVVSVISLLSYIMSWLLYPLVACTHGTHNPSLLKLDKEVVEGIYSRLWYVSILLCPCQNG
jgi:hypothetical protein